MAINQTSLAPSFITYDVDTEDSEASLIYELGEDSKASDATALEKFKTFRIQAGSEKGNKFNIDINLEDLKTISEAAQKDIEIKFRSLRVCQGGSEANIVVLCSQAFRDN